MRPIGIIDCGMAAIKVISEAQALAAQTKVPIEFLVGASFRTNTGGRRLEDAKRDRGFESLHLRHGGQSLHDFSGSELSKQPARDDPA